MVRLPFAIPVALFASASASEESHAMLQLQNKRGLTAKHEFDNQQSGSSAASQSLTERQGGSLTLMASDIKQLEGTLGKKDEDEKKDKPPPKKCADKTDSYDRVTTFFKNSEYSYLRDVQETGYVGFQKKDQEVKGWKNNSAEGKPDEWDLDITPETKSVNLEECWCSTYEMLNCLGAGKMNGVQDKLIGEFGLGKEDKDGQLKAPFLWSGTVDEDQVNEVNGMLRKRIGKSGFFNMSHYHSLYETDFGKICDQCGKDTGGVCMTCWMFGSVTLVRQEVIKHFVQVEDMEDWGEDYPYPRATGKRSKQLVKDMQTDTNTSFGMEIAGDEGMIVVLGEKFRGSRSTLASELAAIGYYMSWYAYKPVLHVIDMTGTECALSVPFVAGSLMQGTMYVNSMPQRKRHAKWMQGTINCWLFDSKDKDKLQLEKVYNMWQDSDMPDIFGNASNDLDPVNQFHLNDTDGDGDYKDILSVTYEERKAKEAEAKKAMKDQE